MKATYCAGLILVGMLTALGAGAATASQPPSVTTARAHTACATEKKATASPKKVPAKQRAPISSKSRSAREIAKKRLPSPRLDLSLPPEMVRQLQPLGAVTQPKRKRLLPNMFGEKPQAESPFQLNGRLINNEMNLQLRNEGRDKEIDGAALDFEFKQ